MAGAAAAAVVGERGEDAASPLLEEVQEAEKEGIDIVADAEDPGRFSSGGGAGREQR